MHIIASFVVVSMIHIIIQASLRRGEAGRPGPACGQAGKRHLPLTVVEGRAGVSGEEDPTGTARNVPPGKSKERVRLSPDGRKYYLVCTKCRCRG